MTKKRVFLKDIAEESGFTINTVSRALHNHEVISKDTRDRIHKIARKLGYIPDATAVSLRNGKSKTIGIMFDHLINPYYIIMTDIIHGIIKKEGYDVMVFTSKNRHIKFELEDFNKMVSRRIDGIISFLKPTSEVVDTINRSGIPTVIFGRDCQDIGLDFITTDDYRGGHLMGNHLTEKGYKNIAYIGGPKSIDCSINRYRGLKDSLIKTDNPLDENRVRFTDNSMTTLKKHVNHMLAMDADAIFCYNDYMALEVINMLSDKGLSVPEDIAIAGYDHVQDILKIPTKLTTVRADKKKLVQSVVNVLFDKIYGHSDSLEQQTLPVYLVNQTTT